MLAIRLVLVSTLCLATGAAAQNGSAPPPAEAPKAQEPTAPPPKATPPKVAKDPLAQFQPKSGLVTVGKLAQVDLPKGWFYLAEEEGRKFLRLKGNDVDDSILGVAVPPDFADSGIFAVYSYDAAGHVDDSETPDYQELLEQMQEGTRQQSEAWQKSGRGTVELLGWAEPPHYDRAQRKLYWAEKLKFGANGGDLTLNYNVRVLGRGGHMVVNGVGDIGQLAVVAAHSKTLLAATSFVQGQRYEDFDPAYDKVAAYGLGALIAGGLATKAGLFAKLALLLKVAIKPILIGLVVLGGALMKLFGRKPKPAEARRRQDGPSA